MDRNDAIELCRAVLEAKPAGDRPYYYGTPFMPHEWVIEAVLVASSALDLVESDGRDADRFRWLTEDHAASETRAKCRELLGRMGVMGRGAARADIDSAMADDIKRSMLRTAGV